MNTAEKTKKTYAEKLKDPLWRMKRIGILSRDNNTCQSCGDNEGVMEVHHKYYLPTAEPYEYPDSALITLCSSCHKVEEAGSKGAYVNLNKAIADAGFTREDVIKLTLAFKNIDVLPSYSYLLMSSIYRAINDTSERFVAPIVEPEREDF
jgi:hypothetical protein